LVDGEQLRVQRYVMGHSGLEANQRGDDGPFSFSFSLSHVSTVARLRRLFRVDGTAANAGPPATDLGVLDESAVTVRPRDGQRVIELTLINTQEEPVSHGDAVLLFQALTSRPSPTMRRRRSCACCTEIIGATPPLTLVSPS
jgi:hypothetical protein